MVVNKEDTDVIKVYFLNLVACYEFLYSQQFNSMSPDGLVKIH